MTQPVARGPRVLLIVTICTVLAVTAGPVLASDPVANGQPSNDTQVSPLDTTGRQILAHKLSLASSAVNLGYTASAPLAGGVQPESCAPPDCVAPSLILSVYARDQNDCSYCGPAAGQVASNYSWSVFSSSQVGETRATNHWLQSEIGAMMLTSPSGGTTGANLAGKRVGQSGGPTGLNKAARLPSGFAYYYTSNGGSAANLYGKLITDVWHFHMLMVLPVKPHQPGAAAWLSSWPMAATSSGHWIALYGYNHFYLTADPYYAIAYYADSADGCAGNNTNVTGKWTDPIQDLYNINKAPFHTGNVVW